MGLIKNVLGVRTPEEKASSKQYWAEKNKRDAQAKLQARKDKIAEEAKMPAEEAIRTKYKGADNIDDLEGLEYIHQVALNSLKRLNEIKTQLPQKQILGKEQFKEISWLAKKSEKWIQKAYKASLHQQEKKKVNLNGRYDAIELITIIFRIEFAIANASKKFNIHANTGVINSKNYLDKSILLQKELTELYGCPQEFRKYDPELLNLVSPATKQIILGKQREALEKETDIKSSESKSHSSSMSEEDKINTKLSIAQKKKQLLELQKEIKQLEAEDSSEN